MWPSYVKLLKLQEYRGIADKIKYNLDNNLKNVQSTHLTLFKQIIAKYSDNLSTDSYREICSKWRGSQGQRGGNTIRGKLRLALPGETTSDFDSILINMFNIDLGTHFLFRGVNNSTEYAPIEKLTATSISLEKAYSYGADPFVVIYVPNQTVIGMPVHCRKGAQGTNTDAEILLVDPEMYIEEITDEDSIQTVKEILNAFFEAKLDEGEEQEDMFEYGIKLYEYSTIDK